MLSGVFTQLATQMTANISVTKTGCSTAILFHSVVDWFSFFNGPLTFIKITDTLKKEIYFSRQAAGGKAEIAQLGER